MKSRMSIFKRTKTNVGTILYNHILNNKIEYLVIVILFFIGLIISVFFINNAADGIKEEINIYLNSLIKEIKNYDNINSTILLKESIISNFIIIFLLWLGASTIIGIPIVYGIVILKGFSIGYTISSIIMCFGPFNGFLISIAIMFLHNIIFIPSMIGASVSGIKLYKSIIKNKQKINIKLEILRHTIFCVIMLMLMTLASIIEVYCSTNLFIIVSKNILK